MWKPANKNDFEKYSINMRKLIAKMEEHVCGAELKTHWQPI
jgi:hypothetical protein